MYIPEHFKVQELVDPEIYKLVGDKALWLMDENLLRAIDLLRKRLGPLTINNWHAGGRYKESGLRRLDTSTGAPKSAHKAGRGVDLKSATHSPDQMLRHILENEAEYSKLIRRVESVFSTPTWLHIDTVDHAGSGIRIFKP